MILIFPLYLRLDVWLVETRGGIPVFVFCETSSAAAFAVTSTTIPTVHTVLATALVTAGRLTGLAAEVSAVVVIVNITLPS